MDNLVNSFACCFKTFAFFLKVFIFLRIKGLTVLVIYFFRKQYVNCLSLFLGYCIQH